MTSVALSAGPIHLGLDTSKNAILVGILRPDQVSPDTEKIFNDDASIRRLIDRFEDRASCGCVTRRAQGHCVVGWRAADLRV
jgi:hypothetical protein